MVPVSQADLCASNWSLREPTNANRLHWQIRSKWQHLTRPTVRPFEGEIESKEWAELHARKLEADRSSAAYQAVFAKRDPLVTVCITTSDRPEVLRKRALASISRQTYTNLQVLVVGDQCDDETRLAIEEVGDPRITYTNLPVRGPYPSPGINRWMVAGTNPANEALRQVRGDFVTHLDEDDTFAESRISELVGAIQASRVDLVYHPFWWERDDASWVILGDGNFSMGQTGTSMILYHRWLAQVPWNIFAFRTEEPGDWNRFRKFVSLGARTLFVDYPFTWHWNFPKRKSFSVKDGETYLD